MQSHGRDALIPPTPAKFCSPGAALAPHAYAGLDVLVLDGAGAGQTARIADNTADSITIDRSWKVLPQRDSLVLLYQLSGECIAYRNTPRTPAFCYRSGVFSMTSRLTTMKSIVVRVCGALPGGSSSGSIIAWLRR